MPGAYQNISFAKPGALELLQGRFEIFKVGEHEIGDSLSSPDGAGRTI
jgi:hypothetical protein